MRGQQGKVEEVAQLVSQWKENYTCHSTPEESMDTTQFEETLGNFSGNNLSSLRNASS